MFMKLYSSRRRHALLSLRSLDIDREAASLALVILEPRGCEQRLFLLELSQVLHTPDHARGRAGRRAIPARASANSAQLLARICQAGQGLRGALVGSVVVGPDAVLACGCVRERVDLRSVALREIAAYGCPGRCGAVVRVEDLLTRRLLYVKVDV